MSDIAILKEMIKESATVPLEEEAEWKAIKLFSHTHRTSA